MKRQVRHGEEFWRATISQQQVSGLSVAAFCRQQDLGPNTFYKWRNRIQADSSPIIQVKKSRLSGQGSRLMELVVQDASRVATNGAQCVAGQPLPSAAKLLEVCLPGGVMLRFHGEQSPAVVSRYLVALNSDRQRETREE